MRAELIEIEVCNSVGLILRSVLGLYSAVAQEIE
jgi:hypothetical protein